MHLIVKKFEDRKDEDKKTDIEIKSAANIGKRKELFRVLSR